MIFSLFLILLCLIAGYGVKQLINEGKTGKIRVLLQKLVLIFFIPFTVATSIWIAPIRNLGIISLPFLGLTALAAGSFISWPWLAL